jgi:hypothetical protein
MVLAELVGIGGERRAYRSIDRGIGWQLRSMVDGAAM